MQGHPRRFALLLVVATVVAYGASVTSGPLWDDAMLITESVVNRAPDGLTRIWQGRDLVDYFPVTFTAFWVQYQAFGQATAGYHLVNITLHALAVLLVWTVLRRLAVPAADLTAMLFAVHPVVGTSVEWISEQKNTLSLVFYALSTLAFVEMIDAGDDGRRRPSAWWAGSVLAYASGLMAKPTGIGLPFFLALLAITRGWRATRSLAAVLPHLLLGVLFGVGTVWFQHHLAIMTEVVPDDPWAVRLAVAGWNVWFYAAIMLVPYRQSLVYPFWTPDPSTVGAWIPDLLLLAVLVMAWRLRGRTGPLPLLGLSFVLLMLAPVMGFVPYAFLKFSRVSDHFVYLAAVGFLGLYASMAQALAQRTMPAQARVVAAAVLVGVLLVIDQGRCRALSTPERCWRSVADAWPDVWVAEANLGAIRIEQRDNGRALPHLQAYTRLQPENPLAHYNLGVAYSGLGRDTDAIGAFEQAVRLEPRNLQAHNNLGVLWQRQGRLDEAAREFKASARLEPSSVQAQYNLGAVLNELQRYDEAVPPLESALLLQPDLTPALQQLAVALMGLSERYAAAGDRPRARAAAERALQVARQAGDADLAAEIARHLDRYRAGLPSNG